jgi:NADPH-dependent curcumin reductase CurA
VNLLNILSPNVVGLMMLKQVMIGYGVAKVVVSGHKDFTAGDLVFGMTGWEDHLRSRSPYQDQPS